MPYMRETRERENIASKRFTRYYLTAFVIAALIGLAIFLVVAGLDIRQFWIAAFVSVAAMMLAGSCFTLLSNHKAKSSYIGEYHRLNKINPVSDHVTSERRGDRGVGPVIARKRSSA